MFYDLTYNFFQTLNYGAKITSDFFIILNLEESE